MSEENSFNTKKYQLHLFRTAVLFFLMFSISCKTSENVSKKDGEFADVRTGTFSFLSKKEKQQRIAVVEFSGRDGSSAYSTAVTDEVIQRLSHEKNAVLVERAKLNTVLREQNIAQSGLVTSDESVAIGRILSADLIVSGVYEKSDGKLNVNGRFADTITGEIVKTFKFTISIELDLSVSSSVVIAEKGCERLQGPVIEAMKDLRRAEDLEKLASRAVRIPYGHECGRIHNSVMSTFKKSGYYPEVYHNFLYESLEKTKPSHDFYKVRDIFHYFAYDKDTSEQEWTEAKKILLRGWRKSFLHYFFDPAYSSEKTVYRRIDEIMKIAESNEIGRPYAIPAEKIAMDLINEIPSGDEKNIEIALYVFENYHPHLSENEKIRKSGYSALDGIFYGTTDKNNQKIALEYIFQYYGIENKDSKTAYTFWHFIDHILDKIEDNKKTMIKVTNVHPDETHLILINRELHDWVCFANDALKNQYAGKDVRAYVLKYRIKCEGSSDMTKLLKDLDSSNKRTQEIALETLAKSGESARPAEKKALQCLKLPGSDGPNARMRLSCAKILGNIRTADPAAIQELIYRFDDLGYRVTDEAMDSVVNIGKHAVPALIRNLSGHKSQRVRANCAIVLGRIGRDAYSAISALQSSARNDSSSYVREQAAGALNLIRR